MQDRQKDAVSCYNTVLKMHPDDAALMAVVANNMLVVNGDRDVFDSKKRVKVMVTEGGSRKLTRTQRSLILFNRCLFALQTNQLELCRQLTDKLREVQPSGSSLSVLLESALLCRERKVGLALQLLQNHLRGCGPVVAGVELPAVLAQLQLSHGDAVSACTTLQAIPAYARHVGVASTLVQLYLGVGQVKEAMQVLDVTLDYWLGQQDEEDNHDSALIADIALKVAQFQLAHGLPETAASVLEGLKVGQAGDLRVTALLITAYSQFNPQRTEELSGQLPPFTTSRQLDMKLLEQVPMLTQTRGSRATMQRAEVCSVGVV